MPDFPPSSHLGRNILRGLLPALALAIFIFPGYIFFHVRGGTTFLQGLNAQHLAGVLFPLFGLYALTLVWIQFILGSLMPEMKKIWPRIEKWHRWEGVFAFALANTHPLLLEFAKLFLAYLHLPKIGWYIWFGVTGLTIMYATVLAALLRKTKLVSKYWLPIHRFNYLLFAVVWWHSWHIGSDVQATSLRWLWIWFGVTYLLAGIWRVIGEIRWRRMLAKSHQTPIAPI